MLSLVNLSAPAKGLQPHAGLFPYPRASPGPPARSHQLWRKPGLRVAWARWQLGLLLSPTPLPSLPEQAVRSGLRVPGGSRLPGCCFIAFRRGCGWEQGGTDVVGLGVTCSAKQGQRRGGYRGGTACIEPPPNIASTQIRSHLRSPLQKECFKCPPPLLF